MIKVRSLSAVLALGALAALPGCSMFGGGEQPVPVAAAPAPAPAPPPPPVISTSTVESARGVVRQVQTKLKAGHMYTGRIDGLWGPLTHRAVTRFQEKNNLQATGDLDEATLQAMNVSMPADLGGGTNSGGMNESGANGTNMPSGNMNDNSMSAPPPMSGPGTGGTAAPAR